MDNVVNLSVIPVDVLGTSQALSNCADIYDALHCGSKKTSESLTVQAL